ncbi:MAG: sterol desaturase family protein [Acidobacteria bacterium]|nr:sterol desaturase family protein [Acidobacteriota bacterium]
MQDVLASFAWQVAFLAGLTIAFTGLAFLSRGRDAFRWPKALRQSALTNFLILQFASLNGALYLVLIAPLAMLYTSLGLPVLKAEAWAGVPIVLKALAALAIYDFSLYWVHRMLHTSWLWPAHAVHHSDPELHFLSWSRGHFTEQFVIAACLVFTSSWMGFRLEEIAGLALIKGLHQYYVHSKLDWDHGIFREVLVSPQMHRWHHAAVPEAYDKNFASIFPVFDLLFGTYYNPGSAMDVPTGVEDNPPNDFISQTLYPFRKWAGMLKARRAPPVEVSAA